MKSSQVRSLIIGIAFFASSLFLALSLWSYNPEDPSLNSIGHRQFATNVCGLFGSFLSDMTLQLLGMTAWAAVGILFYLGVQSVRSKPLSSVERGLWGMTFLLVLASLLSLHFSKTLFYKDQIYIGGVVGHFLQFQLRRLFNDVGVALILWTAFIILSSLAFYTEMVLVKNKSSQWITPLLSRMWQRLTSWKLQWPERAEKMVIHKMESPAQNLKMRSSSIVSLAKSAPATELEELSDEDDEDDEDDELQADEDGSEEETEIPAILATSSEPLKRRKVDLKRKIQRRIANWKLPELAMLEDPPETRYRVDDKEIKTKSTLLMDKLGQFSVKGEVKGAKPGPAVTLFEFKPNADVKISKITELADDLSLALSSESVRIIAPIPGRDVVGIETSNSHRETVYLKDVLALDEFWGDEMKLPMALGRQADGTPKVVDLRKMPHLLVAGTTGSGKSVFVVCALTGLLFRHSPETLRLILIDPKQVDLAAFSDIPHLLLPMVSDPKKAVNALNWAVREMEKRYRSMSKFGARGIEAFNEKVQALTKEQIEEHELQNQATEKLIESYYYTPQPYIVIIVEEFGDLMSVDKNNVEQAVVRLAQMARASGIHLILAMQSPRKDVVTGLIKTNIPGRISFKVASKMDSRIILDDSGAERLLARGDMLFLAPGVAKPERHHGPWVTEEEITEVMKYWSDQGEPEYDEVALRSITREAYASPGANGGEFEVGQFEDEHDERYDEILAWVSGLKTVSASLIQRKFRLGYPRAARLIELFEKESVVGPANGSKPRDVLVRSYDEKST